ncbi:MAG: hypothetical protein WC980_04145 [Candidatus Brocadiia bacterium]
MNADESLIEFKKYKSNVESYKEEFLSESDTRCKFIDKLFIDCLGWSESNIRRESSATDKEHIFRIDYIFGTQIPILVVEAKKKNFIFDFPADAKRKYKISGVISKIKDVESAIEQVKHYATLRSIKYAIITNGTQLIIFVATRVDGIPWDEGDCIVFKDLTDIENNYKDFYNILHAPNFINNSLDKYLSSEDSGVMGVRLIEKLTDPNGTIFRNNFSDTLNKVIENYFSDIVELSNKDALKNCYCLNSELTLYESNLEALLKDNLPFEDSNIKRIKLKSPSGKEEIEQDLQSYSIGNSTEIPILLIGSLGVGKSTFLGWFFEIKIDASLKGRIFPITINFLKGPPDEAKYQEYILDQLIEKLESNAKYNLSNWNIINAIYRDLITKEKKGLLSPLAEKNISDFNIEISHKINTWKQDKFAHLGRLIKYLSEYYGIKVVVIFDNADQKDAPFQTKVYEYANILTRNFKCLSIISLREESYWQASKVGIFDAYHNHVYHLRAPRFTEVLDKRLRFALTKIQKEATEFYASFGAFQVKIADLESFLKLILASILENDRGIEILKFMECLSCGNIRSALNMFKIFLTSGHTKMENYIKNYIVDHRYTVPFHEFARSVMMQDFRYYSEDRNNIVINLFEVDKKGVSSHFTRLRLLELLSLNKNISSSEGKGFYRINDIQAIFDKLNYESSLIVGHLNTLLKYNLIETDNLLRDSIAKSDYVRITAGGEYYLRFLVEKFVYIDVIITDTSIYSDEYFKKIFKLFSVEGDRRNLFLRLDAAKEFISYLEMIESRESESMQGIDPIFKIKFSDRIKASFNRENSNIQEAIKKKMAQS